MDRSFIGRFWTQFEAWLSMLRPSRAGLECAPEAEQRCTVRCILNAPSELEKVLRKDWSTATVESATRILAGKDVEVTNQCDKDVQLLKLGELDKKVRQLHKFAV